MIEVTLVRSFGDDDSVCDAARVSLGRRAADFSPDANARLISYLARNDHFTPFTHCGATMHIRAPVFVARQAFKSKVGFSGDDDAIGEVDFGENEISRRYVDCAPTFFKPAWRVRAPGKKQGSGGPFPPEGVAVCDLEFHTAIVAAMRAYERLLRYGVAPEQARAVLPMTLEVEWVWTGSLAAWARFWRLRTAPDAQDETGEVARQAGDHLAAQFPVSWLALTR